MKRSLLRQILFGLVLSCSLASYVYLNTVPEVAPAIPGIEEDGIELPEQQKPEVMLPDMALIRKLIDAGKSMVSFLP